MSADQLVADLLSTLDDEAVSRSERRAAKTLLKDANLRPVERLFVQHGLFEGIKAQLHDRRDGELLTALEDLLRLLHAPAEQPTPPSPKAYFGPEDPMVETLEALVRGCQKSIEIAVFTLTDDRLAEAIIDRHRHGVKVRILTDDDKSYDRGSDVERLVNAGLKLQTDGSPHHFHHKFAVLDGRTLVTGSYNWTRGADRDNRENFLVTWDPEVVGMYRRAFESLWSRLG